MKQTDVNLLFLIPLKCKETGLDWNLTCMLLNNTLKSIENQSVNSHFTYIVCTDRPEFTANVGKTRVISVKRFNRENHSFQNARIDKQYKIFCGLLAAREVNPRVVMIVDADDLLHRNLVNYVTVNHMVHAFVINRGFRLTIGKNYLRKVRNFQSICGSSVVFPFNQEDFDGKNAEHDFNAFYMTKTDHLKPIEPYFIERGIKFLYVPFYYLVD